MAHSSAAGKITRISPDFRLNLEGVFAPRTSLRHTNLARANLRGGDFRFVDFTGANMKDAILEGTKLQGAILTDVVNLTWKQLEQAEIDESTVLPAYLSAAVGKART